MFGCLRGFSSLLISLIRKEENQAALCLGPEREEEAVPNLEGGLRSSAGGLGHSRVPCAQVLSVSGLLTILGLFPGWERFIPEVSMSLSLLAEPCLFNNRIKTVNGLTT